MVAMLVMTAALQGCGGGEPAAPVQVPDDFPDSPAKLMRNFQVAYEAMDEAAISRMLHPDFVTFLQPGTLFRFPDLDATLDAALERRIHARMFSGSPVLDPDGAYVPAVEAIDFQTLEIQGNWTMSPDNDVIPATESATYDVSYVFDRGQSFEGLTGQGAIKFYVVHRDSVVNGVTRPYYQMRGQVDLTLAKGVEPFCWGTIKAMFR